MLVLFVGCVFCFPIIFGEFCLSSMHRHWRVYCFVILGYFIIFAFCVSQCVHCFFCDWCVYCCTRCVFPNVSISLSSWISFAFFFVRDVFVLSWCVHRCLIVLRDAFIVLFVMFASMCPLFPPGVLIVLFLMRSCMFALIQLFMFPSMRILFCDSWCVFCVCVWGVHVCWVLCFCLWIVIFFCYCLFFSTCIFFSMCFVYVLDAPIVCVVIDATIVCFCCVYSDSLDAFSSCLNLIVSQYVLVCVLFSMCCLMRVLFVSRCVMLFNVCIVVVVSHCVHCLLSPCVSRGVHCFVSTPWLCPGFLNMFYLSLMRICMNLSYF